MSAIPFTTIAAARARAGGKPILLDEFCGAGGAARGYQLAGFYVVGVDNRPQPRYAGDEFIQADAMTFPLEGFDAIHASPPCQAFSIMQHANGDARDNHPDLVDAIRTRLTRQNQPWVIENVPGAPLVDYVTLCGQFFGIRVLRHRLFESSTLLPQPPHIQHARTPKIRGLHDAEELAQRRHVGFTTGSTRAAFRNAMECGWMTVTEANQAIPPAYTEYVGRALLAQMGVVG